MLHLSETGERAFLLFLGYTSWGYKLCEAGDETRGGAGMTTRPRAMHSMPGPRFEQTTTWLPQTGPWPGESGRWLNAHGGCAGCGCARPVYRASARRDYTKRSERLHRSNRPYAAGLAERELAR